MKQMTFYVFMSLMLITACDDSNDSLGKKQLASNALQRNTAGSAQDNGITGEWQLLYWVKDKNDNRKLEEEERKDPITGAQDYMKLNDDGTCLYLVFKQKGRYEVKTNSDGKKAFTIIDVNNKRSPKGYIYSITNDEFILLDGLIFRIYKRT